MRSRLLQFLCCPSCGGSLNANARERAGEEIIAGELACDSCNTRIPVVRGIPRFVGSENYARSFGLQWNRFKRTQLDKFSGFDFSRQRFFETTRWPEDLSHQVILDAGCGAGRFTDVALRSGAEVIAVDLSDAVEANAENNACERLHLVQADIVHLPFRRECFDRLYCLGVLQHTPDPASTLASLVPLLKPGADLAIDVYAANSSRRMNFEERISGYLRRYTVRVDPDRLMRWIIRWVPILLPIKRFLRHCLPLGRRINMIIPIRYGWKRGSRIPYRQLVEWTILETYDSYASSITQPQSLEEVTAWFAEAKLNGIVVKLGPNGINGRGSKAR